MHPEDQGFKQLRVLEPYMRLLHERGITEPTDVQRLAIPLILEGKDCIAQSQTGTGKTLAYALPLMQMISREEQQVQAVVIAPTQELSMQINREIESFKDESGLLAVPLIGGAALQRQVDRLKQRPQIVVGTPGRILELLRMRRLKLNSVKLVVIDEVDQVFKLGSMGEVEQIIQGSPRDRQLVFFSATIPAGIDAIADRWMREQVRVEVEPEKRIPRTITHGYVLCEQRDKIDTLRRLLRSVEPVKAIVFVNETDVIGELVAKLNYRGLSVAALYGEAGKQERATVLGRLESGKIDVLIATDVAARGLDLEALTHVFNFDLPIDADHYVHRAGRTGRVGRPGTVISLLTAREKFIIDKFQKQLSIHIVRKTLSHGNVVADDGSDMRKRSVRERRQTPNDPTAGSAGSVKAERDRRRSSADGAANASNTDASRSVSERNRAERAVKPSEQPGGSARSSQPSQPSSRSRSNQPPSKQPGKKQKKRTIDGKNKGAPRWLKEKWEKQ